MKRRTWKKHFLREVEVIRGRFDDYSNLELDVNADGWTDLVSVNYRSKSLFWVEHPGERSRLIPNAVDEAPDRHAGPDGDRPAARHRRRRPARHPAQRHRLRRLVRVDPRKTGCGRQGGPAVCQARPAAGSRRPRHRLWRHQRRRPRRHRRPATAGSKRPKTAAPAAGGGIPIGSCTATPASQSSCTTWTATATTTSSGAAATATGCIGSSRTRPKRGEQGGRGTRHAIDTSWAQPHSLLLADLDGDGRPKLIAGKRYMGHEGRDPGEYERIEFSRTRSIVIADV
jgi:hypothetical protein